jgi:hypothetical protein
MPANAPPVKYKNINLEPEMLWLIGYSPEKFELRLQFITN